MTSHHAPQPFCEKKMKKIKTKLTISIISVAIVFLLLIVLCFVFYQPLNYYYVIKSVPNEKFDTLSHNQRRIFFDECVKIQTNADEDARQEMLTYIWGITDKYPEVRDIAAINCQSASIGVKADCYRVLVYGKPFGPRISQQQAKEHIPLFLRGINDDDFFIREVATLGLIIAKYDDLPFLKKHISPLFDYDDKNFKESFYINLIIYTGFEDWRKEFESQLEKDKKKIMAQPSIETIEKNLKKKDGTMGVLEQHELDSIRSTRKIEKRIMESIEWYLSDDNITQILRQKMQRVKPTLELPPLPVFNKEIEDKSQNKADLGNSASASSPNL